jgi:predicted Zn-dependent protease
MDLASRLSASQPETVIGSLKEGMRERVRDRWSEILMKDSQVAADRNQGQLYPNPSLQAYVNRLGQSLIPREVSENVSVTFKIIEDPLPYADSLATGTVYLSSGIISLLDNESQLAFLLMHEAGHFLFSHHVQQAIEDEKVEKRADQIKLAGGAAGALLTGGLVDGVNLSSMILGSYGGKLGYDLGNIFGPRIASAFSGHRFRREIQLESDLFATEIVLRHGFDAREAPALMAKVGDIVQRSNAAVELAFGNARDLPHRSDTINELLGGLL